VSRWSAVDGAYPLPRGGATAGLLRRLRTCGDTEPLRVLATTRAIHVTRADGGALSSSEDAHVRASLASHEIEPWT
jgi:hypothetical protein